MVKVRKRPVVVDAHRWWKNGDHPEDDCRMMYPEPNSVTQFEPFLSEGRVVRYYRTPSLDGDSLCKHCNLAMHDHGWIDTLEGGHIVCPGDWIITGVNGERYPCKPDVFDKTYEIGSMFASAARASRQVVRGCGSLPYVGPHPGTGIVFGMIALGALGGYGGWAGPLVGAAIMASIMVPFYLVAAYERAAFSDKLLSDGVKEDGSH